MQNILFDKMIGSIYGDPVKCELEYRRVYKYLSRYVKPLIISEPFYKVNPDVKENKTIWILWYQGMEKAPRLVRQCYKSVLRNKPDDFEVVLLTENNISDYICLPTFILDKVSRGIISKTHLSDLIRLELLCEYGGCWIDATVYCSEEIPEYMLSGDMFFLKESLHNVSVSKISNWWIFSKKRLGLICHMRNLLYDYWKKESKVRNYYLFHIAFSRLIDSDPYYQECFEDVPYFNNSNSHVLWGKMSATYEVNKWNIIKSASSVHKLSNKRKFIQGDIYNFYMAFIEDKLI